MDKRFNIKKVKEALQELKPAKEIAENRKHFTENEYVAKLLKYAKKIGVKTAYYSLLLFYALQSPATPKKAKLTIAGALGYLIFPADILPDVLPVVGFTDDAAIILYALYRVISHIDDDVKSQAHERMKKIFGEDYDVQQEIEQTLKPVEKTDLTKE